MCLLLLSKENRSNNKKLLCENDWQVKMEIDRTLPDKLRCWNKLWFKQYFCFILMAETNVASTVIRHFVKKVTNGVTWWSGRKGLNFCKINGRYRDLD